MYPIKLNLKLHKHDIYILKVLDLVSKCKLISNLAKH